MPYFKITALNKAKDLFEDIHLPGKFEVCPACQGSGTQDCWEGGMTGDEMAEQGPEFFEDYMNGVYSKPCDECKGQRVVVVPAKSLLTKEQLALVEKDEADKEAYYKELAAEAQYVGYF